MKVRKVGMMKKNKGRVWRVIKVMFPKMLRSCPGMFVLSAVFGILNSVCMGILIYLSQELYDSLLNAVAGVVSKREVIVVTLIFGGFTIGNQILNGLNVFIMNVMFKIINRDLTYELHAKADRLRAMSFEKETIYNQFQMAIQGRNESVFLLFICFTPITCHLPLYMFMGSYFYILNPSFVLAILLIWFPICISYYYKIKAKAVLVNSAAAPSREMKYYHQCIIGREFFRETRLLGAMPFFRNLYTHTMQMVNSLEVAYKTKSLKIDFISKLITLVGYGCVLYMIFTNVIAGTISIGAFAAVLNGIGLLFDEMKELISDDIGENIGSMGSIKSLIDFLELPEEQAIGQPVQQDILALETIRLKGVSFKYPNSENYVLKDVDLEIKPGEKMALVGANGSGKTTLTKLLLGLYQPTLGEIIVGARHDEQGAILLSGLTSAVFQDFRRYKMTLRQNIMISDVLSGTDEEELYSVMRDAGIPQELALDTNLSVEFGGIDLSGGQWQKVAIARGIYRKHHLIVLDEPTSAIDPIEESDIYQKFVEIIKDRTAILVTHRIGAAKIADRIVIMEEGRCIDSGTHQQLMSSCESYRRMYYAQADWYS